MNALFEAAKEVGGFMSARKWRYCVIGGLAVLRWGEPRTTLDVDIALMTGFGGPMCEVKDAPELLERARRVLGMNR